MKYLHITGVIGAQKIFYEISPDYLYSYSADKQIRESHLIDRHKDTIYTISGNVVIRSHSIPNVKNLGWTAGETKAKSHEIIEDSILGRCLKVHFYAELDNESSTSRLNKEFRSGIIKTYINVEHELIQKHMVTAGELEHRVFIWNQYMLSEKYPFHVRTEQITDDGSRVLIMKMKLEEREPDKSFKSSRAILLMKKFLSKVNNIDSRKQ